jgi:Cu-Zn family superoxide dismutase
VDESGKAKVNTTMSGVIMTDGAPNSLFKEGGTALMVHANPDDLKTDPTGNAGGRIACGVFSR